MGKSIYIAQILGVILFVSLYSNAYGQYFGQNRPIYKTFNFKVHQTPHFEIYHYFEDDTIINRLAQSAEQWYTMHQQVFRDTIKKRNPIIFYKNHADFQQTTAIMGSVGVGTGGVTEAFKNRVIMPVTEGWAQTDHVLGHELVHAFQFNSILTKDSTNLYSLQNLPLWMVEGMAEYLSIGSVDPHTAMWMRDAVLNDKFPTLEQLTRDQRYFPYRYGQAFWAFVGRTFGDSLIVPIFEETAKRGYNSALVRYLGLNEAEFSKIWKKTYQEHFLYMMKDSVDNPPGAEVIYKGNSGHVNISPSISPDGQYVAFYSEQDLFSIDLFLAETATGRTVKKLTSLTHNNEIDALNFIESAGAWSPDSKMFAFVGFRKGKNTLLVLDVNSRKIVYEIDIPGVPSFNYPTWSPDSRSVVVSGLVEGVNNLYQYFLDTKEVIQLTDDRWCQIHPHWSPDGRFISFSTDLPPTNMPDTIVPVGLSIATLNMGDGEIKPYHFFHGASNLSPSFSPDGESLYFLSDRDGYRNLYRFQLTDEKVFQETKILTGISGMTELAPAFSVASQQGKLAYSYYFDGDYSIFIASSDDFLNQEVVEMQVDMTAATLPPLNRSIRGIVDDNMDNRLQQEIMSADSFKVARYRPKFKLDYIANSGIGVATGYMGTGMAGGVEMLFSDVVGANMFHAGLALNGEIYDFGGQLTYINQKHRVNWSATAMHLPYTYALYDMSMEFVNDVGVVERMNLNQIRIFESVVGGMAQFPISKNRRFEAGGYLSWYNYRVDIHSYVYVNGLFYGYEKNKGEAPEGYALQRANLAYVVDNSAFGLASPMDGTRQRFQLEQVFGYVNYLGTLVDLRKYFYKKPFSFAMRGYYYGRHGKANLDRIYPLYLGYPWIIRGYDNSAFQKQISTPGAVLNPNQLMGDHMAMVSVEIRLPFTGPERLAVFNSKMLFTELTLFADAGLAWHQSEDVMFTWKPKNLHENQRVPVVSTGLSLRVNLFGMLVLEPYFAIPFQLGGIKASTFGLNFTPGW